MLPILSVHLKYLDEIKNKYRSYFDFIDELFEFVPAFLPQGKNVIKKRANEKAYVTANLVFFTKSYKTLRAIKILCLQGLGSDANALLRLLLECLINILFISEGDKEKKALEYFAFCHMQDLKMFNAIKNDLKLKDELPIEQIDKILRERTKIIVEEWSEPLTLHRSGQYN